MRRSTGYWGVLVVVAACSRDAAEVRRQVDALTLEAASLQERVTQLRSDEENARGRISELQSNETVLRAIKESKSVQYLLKLSIRQVHYSLNIKKQIADAVNEEEFEIATDRDTFERAHKGQDLFDSFRVGSAIMKGSLGSWRLKIVAKRTVTQ